MSVVNRKLNIKYFAKSAPKISIREYNEIIKEYEKNHKLPPRLEIMGIAIDDSMNSNMWKVPTEDLDEIASKLKDVQVRKNHSDRVEDIIGVVKEAWREDNKVFYVAEIADDEIIKKMLLGYIRFSSIQVYSDDVYCAKCLSSGKNEMEAKLDDFMNPCPRCGGKELIIRHPTPIEISIVSLPAYENAIIMPVGFKAALNQTLEEKFKYTISVYNTHVKNETNTSEEKGVSGNRSLPEKRIMSFKAQDTAAPSAEIREPKPLTYEDVMKAISDSQKQIQDYFEKAIKALQEEVKKLTEEVKKTKKDEPEEEEEEEEEKKEEEAKKKKLEAKLRAKAKINAFWARKRREELRKKIEERRKKKEEEEARKKKIEELKKKLEEVKKKIEEAKKAKKVEAGASGKGVVGEVKEESGLTGDVPEWWKEILGASKKTGFLVG